MGFIDIVATARQIHHLFVFGEANHVYPRNSPSMIVAHAIAHYFLSCNIPHRFINVVRYRDKKERRYYTRIKAGRPDRNYHYLDASGSTHENHIYFELHWKNGRPTTIPKNPSVRRVALQNSQEVQKLTSVLCQLVPVPVFQELRNKKEAKQWLATKVSRGSRKLRQQAKELLGEQEYNSILYQKQLQAGKRVAAQPTILRWLSDTIHSVGS